ncbi:MAG TPA: TRAP transporter substrate-binding protein [Burkholderiaceae bacterium]
MNTTLIRLTATLALLAAGGATLAQDIQERTIRFGHLNNTDHPTSTGVKKFAELVAAKSGGKITVKEFPSSQLGNELQQQSALQGGVQEMLTASTTSLTGIVKEFGLFDFPFLFTSGKQADAMVDGPLGKMLSGKLADKGVVVLGFFDLGFRNVTNSKRPITKGEDLDGLKLRVIPNPVFLETFKTFKANPLPMPFAELYNALESKAVDGQENPYSVILSSKFYEVNKFVSGTNHVYATNPVQISKKFWDRLSPVEQKLLQDAATEAQNFQRVASREVAGKALNELKAKGMQYNDIAPAEMARMRADAKAVHDKFAASYEPAVVTLFKSELERVSKL